MIRLVYASAAKSPFGTEELATLLRGARANNSRLDITGVLLHHQGSFLQVLEGDPVAVEKLFERIGRDPRHDRLLVLGRFEVEERAFGEWSMGSLELKALRTAKVVGLSDFLEGGILRLESDHAAVNKILEGFRDGRFRQHVR
jgi:hypothetical protein